MFKKSLTLILLFCLLGLQALILQDDCHGQGTVSIMPQETIVTVNDTFSLHVAIDDSLKTLMGYLMDFEIDTSVIKLDSCFNTSFFPGWFLYWKDLDTTSTYMYEVLNSLCCGDVFVDGPGNILRLRFRAVNAGVSDVNFRLIDFRDTVGTIGNQIQLSDSLDGRVIVCYGGNAVIGLSQYRFNFSAQAGDANPPSQNLELSDACTASQMVWSASNSSDWLSLSNHGGTMPDQITLNVDISGLSGGSYVDTILIHAPAAINSPEEAVVYLDVTQPDYLCGDANGDGDVNVSDAVWIINYVFVNGDPPDPLQAGEVNCDGSVNVSDAVWIINYVFVSGYAPCDTNGDGEPDC